MRAELIYNSHAGHALVRRELGDVVVYLRRNGWTVTTCETSRPGEATGLARQAVRRGAQVVIAAGGDGTVNEVACGLVGSDAALGVLPVGTTNVWALQMRIPALNPIYPGTRLARWVSELEERIESPLPIVNRYRRMLLNAARVLVQGQTVAVDVGEANGRCFLMWAGIGLDAAITESVSQEEKRALGSWAFVIPALDTVRGYPSADVTLTMDGKVLKTNSGLIVVSNIQLYGAVMPIGAKACLTDAKLDVCIFKGQGLLTFVRHALKVLSRQHLRDPQIEYFQCREVVVESTRALPVHADDEPFTRTPVTIRTLPRALRVITSQDAPQSLFCP